MKKFLKELEMELKMLKMNNKDIDEILEDHKEMIDAAIDEGLNETEIEEKFGNPKNVAKELSKDTKESKKSVVINVENSDSCVKDNTSKYDLVEAFPVVSLSSSHVSVLSGWSVTVTIWYMFTTNGSDSLGQALAVVP